jgi:NAD(P)-dependent dehydrogenase (short-subunit alcohol dehydrogenase family)
MPLASDFPESADALAGRVILLAGANGGLGQAAAMACARAGATVVLLGRRVPKLSRLYDAIEQSGAPQPAIYPLDLEGATPADYAELATRLGAELGHLDGIVHAAAHFAGLASVEGIEPEEWVRALHVNLTAPLLLTRACLPLLRQSADAAVVFLQDDPARVRRAYWGGYAIAKAGLEGALAVLADETANSPVRVSALRPGPMRTGLRARAWFGEDPATVTPPAVYAPACVFLLSADGAAWRGMTMPVDAA